MLIDTILLYVSDGFNFPFIISINVIVYIIVMLLTNIPFKGKKLKIQKYMKILITIVVTIILAIIYYRLDIIGVEKLINSSIVAPVFWDWIVKPICKFIRIDYDRNEINN